MTTVMSMLSSEQEYTAARLMVEQCGNGTRIGAVVPPELAESKWPDGPQRTSCIPDLKNTCRYPRYLGASGIKTIIDGSTQGCTAAVQGEQNIP